VQKKRSQKGFTLIELLIVVAILASVAIPSYALYRNKSRFAEALLAVGSVRSAMVVATATGRVGALTDLDSGAFGLPPTIPQGPTTNGIDVVDGVITVTWMADGTDLAGETYTLSAGGVLPPVQWTPGGSCIGNGYC